MGREIISIEQDILWPVVLCDQALPNGVIDGIFIFSRDDGIREIAELAGDLYRTAYSVNPQRVPLVVKNGTTQVEWERKGITFGGTEMWRSLLLRRSVLGSDILATRAAYHTGAEADELVRIAKEREWNVVILVAMPYHILRCFLTVIQAMEKAAHYLDVYNLTLPSLLWQKSAPKVLLDGTFEQGTRLDHIAGEHKRIRDYTQKSLCATRDAALAYLARRGKIRNT